MQLGNGIYYSHSDLTTGGHYMRM